MEKAVVHYDYLDDNDIDVSSLPSNLQADYKTLDARVDAFNETDGSNNSEYESICDLSQLFVDKVKAHLAKQEAPLEEPPKEEPPKEEPPEEEPPKEENSGRNDWGIFGVTDGSL